MIGMSATVNATDCVLACAAHWLMIGFSDSDWKPTPIRGQRTSLSERTLPAHSQKATTESLWVRHISVTQVSRTSSLQAAECHSHS